jgi:hypothetical protein
VSRKDLIDVALGRAYADTIVQGGQVVDVHTGEIRRADITIRGGRIASVGTVDAARRPETQIIDAAGLYVAPGLIDGHLHYHHLYLDPSESAKLLLSHGITATADGFHGEAIVGGIEAVRAIKDAVRRRPTIMASGRDPGRDGVVPLRMERITLDIDAGHLVVADLDPLGVIAAVELASHDQTGLGCRGGDQVHHRQPVGQESFQNCGVLMRVGRVRGSREEGCAWWRLVWWVKPVAELRLGVLTETEVTRIERDEQAGVADLGLRLRRPRSCWTVGVDGPTASSARVGLSVTNTGAAHVPD